jgi:hypothetical protein
VGIASPQGNPNCSDWVRAEHYEHYGPRCRCRVDFRVLKYFPFGGAKRLDLVAEFFNLFNRANVSQINPVFGSGPTPIPGFAKPVQGTGARQIQFSLDFEF